MKLTTVKQIWENREAYLDREIDLGGWVRSNRDSKSFGFLTISDGSFFEPLQVVYHDSLSNFQTIRKINVGAALIIRGTLVATPAKSPSKAIPHRTIRSRRSAILRNFCAPFCTCAPAQICSRQLSACALSLRLQFTASSRREILSMSTRRSSLRAMPRVPAKCSA